MNFGAALNHRHRQPSRPCALRAVDSSAIPTKKASAHAASKQSTPTTSQPSPLPPPSHQVRIVPASLRSSLTPSMILVFAVILPIVSPAEPQRKVEPVAIASSPQDDQDVGPQRAVQTKPHRCWSCRKKASHTRICAHSSPHRFGLFWWFADSYLHAIFVYWREGFRPALPVQEEALKQS